MLRETPMPVKTEIILPSREDELANTIDEMIARLEWYGWRKHSMGGENGPNCIMGALRWIDKDKFYEDVFVLNGVMKINNFARWNDRPWRTKGQVIRKLRRTAKKLRDTS